MLRRAQTNQHRVQDRQYSRSISIDLLVPANDNATIIKTSVRALDMIYHKGYNYKKCGVMVMDLIPDERIQSALFEPITNGKIHTLMKTIDTINSTNGKETVRMGVQVGEKKYRLRADHLSRNYTTNINELPETV